MKNISLVKIENKFKEDDEYKLITFLYEKKKSVYDKYWEYFVMKNKVSTDSKLANILNYYIINSKDILL